MTDLQQRVPGHALIDELLHQWDLGTIRLGDRPDEVIVTEEASGWYRGVLGERHIAFVLSGLGEKVTVLHSVPVGRGSSDIDHIVISTAGVFTINTKYSPGMDVWFTGIGMYVGGFPQPYIRNSLAEARRAAHRLSRAAGLTVPVTGLVVFVRPGRWSTKAPAGGKAIDDPTVHVIHDRDLIMHVTGRPVFSQEQVDRIVAAAVLPRTWHDSPRASTPGAHIAREFAALEAAVGPQLAAPAASVSTQRTSRPTRTRQTRHAPARSPRTRPAYTGRSPARGSSRRRTTRWERLISGLVGPAVMIVGGIAMLNYLTSR